MWSVCLAALGTGRLYDVLYADDTLVLGTSSMHVEEMAIEQSSKPVKDTVWTCIGAKRGHRQCAPKRGSDAQMELSLRRLVF